MRMILIAALCLAIAGCATQAEKMAAASTANTASTDNQIKFYNAQAALRQPLLRIKGIPGQTISMSGVESLEVWAPEKQAEYKEAPLQRSDFIEGLAIVKDGTVEIAKVAAPVVLGVKAINGVERMSDNIASGRGPVTTTTTTTSNANVSNANVSTNNANVSNANQANSANVTTSYANQANQANVTTGANSVVGSGTSSAPQTTTTSTSTVTDAHPVTTTTTTSTDNHSVTTQPHGTCTTGSC